MEALGSRIKSCRKAIKMSQIALARALNITGPSVHQWEANITYPSADNLLKMADILKVSANYLVTGDKRSPKEKEADELAESIGEDAIKALHLYRQLSLEMRETALLVVQSLAEAQRTKQLLDQQQQPDNQKIIQERLVKK